jgi:DNA-binding response OmpR family regulator
MRILIVEDEPVQRIIVAEACRAFGHQVRAFASHSDVLEIASAWRPELVICPLEAFVMGVERGSAAASVPRDRAWVVLTVAEASRIERARGLADVVLLKPFSLRELMSLVEMMGGEPRRPHTEVAN